MLLKLIEPILLDRAFKISWDGGLISTLLSIKWHLPFKEKCWRTWAEIPLGRAILGFLKFQATSHVRLSIASAALAREDIIGLFEGFSDIYNIYYSAYMHLERLNSEYMREIIGYCSNLKTRL